jgi:predicted HTH transcriptional regulator
MLTEETVRRLLGLRTENKNLDYKEKFNWMAASSDEKCGLIKDILAMLNTQDGGRIIFGVSDADFRVVGLDKASYEAFDTTTKVNDFLCKHRPNVLLCCVQARYRRLANSCY